MVPADYVMNDASANALRAYVRGGGTVLMTAFSAKVDEHGQWFDTPLPGRLSDVFGLRTSAFYVFWVLWKRISFSEVFTETADLSHRTLPVPIACKEVRSVYQGSDESTSAFGLIAISPGTRHESISAIRA